MIDVTNILLLVAITVVLGYVGDRIFQKTRIPDVIWLMGFGVLVGPVFGFVDIGLFMAISPLLITIALLLILFDAGLNMNFYQMLNQAPRSILMAAINIILVIVIVGYVSHIWFGLSLLTGMLLGAIVGGTSSPVVISIVRNIGLKDKTKVLLSLESVITDVLCIVIAIAIIQTIVSGDMGNPLHSILSPFSIGGVIGLLAGIVWLVALDKIKGKPFDYILTLAILFLLYIFVEASEGSGAVAALMFGVVLGNGYSFSHMLRLRKIHTVDDMIKSMQREIAFFIRAFFFVFLGVVVTISQDAIVYGIIISLVIIVLRIIVAKISIIGIELPNLDRKMIAVMSPRGLAAAVLAEIAIASSIPGAGMFTTIIFMVIFSTIIFTTIATAVVYRKCSEKKNDIEAS